MAGTMRFVDKRESDWVNLTTLHENATVFTLGRPDFSYNRDGARQLRAACYDYTTGEKIGTFSTTGVIVVEQIQSFLDGESLSEDMLIGPLTVGKGERAFYLEDAGE